MASVPETCLPFDEDLSALLDGELAPPRADEVEAHVVSCVRCQARLAAFRSVGAQLRGVGAPEVPPALEARLLARLAAESGEARQLAAMGSRPRRRPRVARVLAVAALAAAALALYFGVLRGPRPPVSGPSEAPVARQERALPTPNEAAGPDAPRLPSELEAASDEELSLALDLETLEDLDVITNLDLLEKLKARSGKDRG